MTTAGQIYSFLKQMAPLDLAESYDNPGMLTGNPDQPVTGALIALDITRDVCAEAGDKGMQLIISHHPVIFKPIKSVVKNSPTGTVWELASRGLTAVCMHTNLDTAPGGVNDTLAQVLGLQKTGPLLEADGTAYKKVAVFVPAEYADKVRRAMAEAGAGKLGNYDSCAYGTEGTGYFRPLPGSDPFIGSQRKLESVKETRLEAICRARDLSAVIAAVLEAHPYEEPAFDIFDDQAVKEERSIGMMAELSGEAELDDFARFVCGRLTSGGVSVCRAGGMVRRIALCSGAWDDELTLYAQRRGADTIVTGELKHSAMLLALAMGLNVIAAGHFATETVICAKLAQLLGAEFGGVRFEVAGSNRNPAYFLTEK